MFRAFYSTEPLHIMVLQFFVSDFIDPGRMACHLWSFEFMLQRGVVCRVRCLDLEFVLYQRLLWLLLSDKCQHWASLSHFGVQFLFMVFGE